MSSILPTACSSRLQAILFKHNIIPLAIWENLHEKGKKVLVLVQRDISALAGVYVIINLVTGDLYVGSGFTGRLAVRYYKHLISGNGSSIVWAAVQKYGLENFAFTLVHIAPSIVKLEDNKELMERETYFITTLEPKYNIAKLAGNTFGVLHTEATREKLRSSYTSERREMIGNLNRGKKLSPTTRAKIREASLNRKPMSAASRALISANSTLAQLFKVKRVDGSPFLSPEGIIVESVIIRTYPCVVIFLGCGEKTVRRAIKKSGIIKSTWLVVLIGKANPSL